MWTMTSHGFFSAVQHNTDPTLLVVRARVRADAEFLRSWYDMWRSLLAECSVTAALDVPEPIITANETSDYPWRVIMPRTAYGAFMAESVEDLSYGNFKDHVKDHQGQKRADTYSRVWWALLSLEQDDPQGRPEPMYRNDMPVWSHDDDLDDWGVRP